MAGVGDDGRTSEVGNERRNGYEITNLLRIQNTKNWSCDDDDLWGLQYPSTTDRVDMIGLALFFALEFFMIWGNSKFIRFLF